MKTKQLQKSIPDGWQQVKLGDYLLHSPDYGINAAAVEFSDALPAYIRITDISEDGKFLSIKKTSVDHPDSKRYVLADGDIVFARTGASVGKSYLYDQKDGKLVFAGFLIRMKPNKEKLNSAFLSAYTHTSKYKQWVEETSPRSGQPGINSVEYSNLRLLVPPLPEQNRIVSVLKTWDESIEKLACKIKAKKQVKKSLMQDLLTGKKRLIGFKDKWQTVEVGELLDYEQPTKYVVSNTNYSDGYNTPALTANKGFILGYTNETEGIYKNFPVIIFDDFTMDNKFVDFEFKIKSSAIKILTPKNKNVNLKFIFERIQLINIVIGEHRRHYLSEYQYITIDIPDIKEQNAIAKILTTADKEITELEKKLSIIKEQKRYLLNNLITGTIRTPETLSAKLTK